MDLGSTAPSGDLPLEPLSDPDLDIEVNLVDMGACRASLRDVIEREGIDV